MYRIAKITELPESNFDVVDKALVVDNNKTTINAESIDKEHRTSTYLSSAVNTVNDAHNRLSMFENTVLNNYFTTDLTSTYISNGSLIHDAYITELITLGSKGAFLTVDDATAFKTECVALIQQLKEKIMNIFTANLELLFKKQQSLAAVPIGSSIVGYDSSKEYAGSTTTPELIANNEERWNSSNSPEDFDMFSGNFSLRHLIAGFTDLQSAKDVWHEHAIDDMFTGFSDSIDELKTQLNALTDKCVYGFCNEDPIKNTGAIVVPSNSVNDNTNKTQPIATLVFEILKQQIYLVMKNAYIQYLVKMTAYPDPQDNS